MVAYAKPTGYNTLCFQAAQAIYRPNNGALNSQVMRYGPVLNTKRRLTITFSAAPDDLSELHVQDGSYGALDTPTRDFVFTYGGSPGTGVIPLVMGGGTAAQAATATFTALAAELTHWDVSNPSAGVVVLESHLAGVNPTLTDTGDTNTGVSILAADVGVVLPGKFGKNYCYLPDTAPPEVG